MIAETDRLRRQAAEAQARLEALLEQRERAFEGCGPSPSPTEIDRARAATEAALALLMTYQRTVAA